MIKPSVRLAPGVLPTAGLALHIRRYVRKAFEAVHIGVDAGGYFSQRPRTAGDNHTHVTPLASRHNGESYKQFERSIWKSCVINYREKPARP
jgi:hypothetical protein